MRIPLLRPWRAFRELDDLSDLECDGVVRDALLNAPSYFESVPWWLGGAMLLAWPSAVVIASGYIALSRYVPIPADATLAAVELLLTTVLAGAGTLLLSRGVILFVCIRRYLARSACRKCGQPLHGLPIGSIGAEPNPANQSVRCAECGTKYNLLELGITPRDLVPLEQRRVDPHFGSKRGGATRGGR